jgi:hypothetical protein
MSYYNDVYVIFKNGEGLDWRTAGQMLPAGSIPLAVANANNEEIVEIINDYEPEIIINFVNTAIQNNFQISKKYSQQYKAEYVAKAKARLPNWKYIHS